MFILKLKLQILWIKLKTLYLRFRHPESYWISQFICKTISQMAQDGKTVEEITSAVRCEGPPGAEKTNEAIRELAELAVETQQRKAKEGV